MPNFLARLAQLYVRDAKGDHQLSARFASAFFSPPAVFRDGRGYRGCKQKGCRNGPHQRPAPNRDGRGRWQPPAQFRREVRRRGLSPQRGAQSGFEFIVPQRHNSSSRFLNRPRNNVSERCRWLFTVLIGISSNSDISVGSRSSWYLNTTTIRAFSGSVSTRRRS